MRSRGFNFRTALIVGTGPKAAQFADFLEAHPHWGFRVVGYLDDDNGGEIGLGDRWPCLGTITNMEAVLGAEVIDEVIFVIEKGKLAEYEDALLVAERHGVRAHVSLDIFPHVLARPVLEELDGIPLLSFTTTPSNPAELAAKRTIDLVLALVLFVVTLPVQILAALAILLLSGTPVFFRQVRCGLNGRHFTLLKFRTMESGRRGPAGGDLAPERDDGPGVQGAPRPPADRGRQAAAPPVDRRAAAALERDRGRHEPGRPAPAAARRGRRATSPGRGAGSA